MEYAAFRTILSPMSVTGNKNLDKYLQLLGYTPEMAQNLLHGCEEHSWKLLPGAVQMVDYLIQLDKDTPICVIGDYDADGVTSTTIWMLLLRRMQFTNTQFYIPHRVKDGYGLSTKVIDKVLTTNPDIQVLLTCDNGIVAKDAVQYALDKGLKVCVTDHHTPQEGLTEKVAKMATCLVHPAPHLGNDTYPFTEISGAQVVYKIATGVYETMHWDKDDVFTYMFQLASISIVSDVMPVGSMNTDQNENREWLRKGLHSLQTNPNWHLSLLALKLKNKIEDCDETTIGFYLAPAINAVGRLKSAKTAVNFLLESDPDYASDIADVMVFLNEQRKALKKEWLEKISSSVDTTKKGILIRQEGIPEGIVGILAGNLCDTYSRPTIVFTNTTVNGQRAWKGSGRSVEGIDLFKLLSDIPSEFMFAFGGHKGAAGLTVLDSQWEDFSQSFEENLEKLQLDVSACAKHYLPVFAGDIGKMSEDMMMVKPFGNGLPQPLIRSKIYVNQVDIYFKSGSVKCSSVFWDNERRERVVSNTFWIFGQMEEFMANCLDGFSMSYSNLEKKLETMSLEDAKKEHMETWKNDKGVKPVFDVLFELDYEKNLQGVMAPAIRVEEYKRI